MSIDWSKPLELFDGTPVRLGPHVPSWAPYCNGPNGTSDEEGDYWVEREDGEHMTPGMPSVCVDPDGTIGFRGLSRVRNRG